MNRKYSLIFNVQDFSVEAGKSPLLGGNFTHNSTLDYEVLQVKNFSANWMTTPDGLTYRLVWAKPQMLGEFTNRLIQRSFVLAAGAR